MEQTARNRFMETTNRELAFFLVMAFRTARQKKIFKTVIKMTNFQA